MLARCGGCGATVETDTLRRVVYKETKLLLLCECGWAVATKDWYLKERSTPMDGAKETERKTKSHPPADKLADPALGEFFNELISETVLEEAARLVGGDRQKHYGHPIDNYNKLALAWTAILYDKLEAEGLDALDCVRMLAVMKMVRDTHTPKRDNWVDIAGYARVGEMIAEQLDLFEAAP